MGDLDIRTDAQAVKVIDDLKHRLKTRGRNETIANALNTALNKVIEEFGLGWDQHSFARLPQDETKWKGAIIPVAEAWRRYDLQKARGLRDVLGRCDNCRNMVYDSPGGSICDSCGGGVDYTRTRP